MRNVALVVLIAACHASPAPPVVADPPLPLQIKDAHDLAVRGEPAPFTLTPAALGIDGREIPIIAYDGAPLDAIAKAFARVPPLLRGLITGIEVSSSPSPLDAAWALKYHAHVVAGMSAVASGNVTVYPHGIDELSDPDADVFTRNLMHELGHAWTLHEWATTPGAKDAWLRAIASDRRAPSRYAVVSFQSSGWPFEDAAEATALYFLVLGTPAFEAYRTTMPARFALIHARFGV
jgi:hypothetical protein